MAAGGHFALWKSEKSLSVAFLDISDKYETFFLNFYKMATGAILDVRNSLLIAFLAISDQYATLFFLYLYFCDFVYKMAAGGHFECPKITFGSNAGHFR